MRKESYWRGSAIRPEKKRGVTYDKLKTWGDSFRCPKCSSKLLEGKAVCPLCGWDKE